MTSFAPTRALRLALPLYSMPVLAAALLLAAAQGARAEPAAYYVCPGNVFTNTISSREAQTRGCTLREATEPTTIAGPKLRSAPAANSGAVQAQRSSYARVDTNEQKARDADARRILEAELRKEEQSLEALKREYNNGAPERRGDERNYQRYLDRVAELKSAIGRKEGDMAAIRRELGKLGT